MEYQKVANLIDQESSSEPSKFETKNWVEVNDESRGTYNVNSQTKFQATILKSSSPSNFWRTFEMPLINCEVSLILTWSSNCVITNSTGSGEFEITDTKLYVPVVTLSTQDNAKLLQQLKSGFKRVVNWNKYLSEPELLARNSNLNHLIEPSFQGVNRLFVLAFEDDAQRISHSGYYVEIKYYNVMINRENFLISLLKMIK